MGFFSALKDAFKATSAGEAAQQAETAPLAPQSVQLRRGSGAVSAVGEQHHTRSLRRVWKLARDHEHITVALVPEPHNPHDPNAVRMDVLIDNQAFTAGYLPREDARQYARALQPLTDRGMVGVGDGKIRIDGSGRFQVYARLSEDPKMILPPTITDDLGRFVDGFFDLTVTGEEPHQDFLKQHARRPYPIAFALHPVAIEKGTHKGKTTFAVYLDGTVVGQLTRAMTEKHFHVIDSVIRSGYRPYLAGRIESDHRGFQVILDGPSQPRV